MKMKLVYIMPVIVTFSTILTLEGETGYVTGVTLPEPLGFWQFNDELQGKDLSGYQNHPTLESVTMIAGPNGENTAVSFAGTSNSYIRIPNNGALNTSTFTVLMQVQAGTKAGPMFSWLWNETMDSYGTHIGSWPNASDFAFSIRDAQEVDLTNHLLVRASIFTPNEWVFAAVTYDYLTGNATLWFDGKVVSSSVLGSIVQMTDKDVLIGHPSWVGWSDYWDGKIACYQFYDKALNNDELLEAQRLCSVHGLKSKKECYFKLVENVGVGYGVNASYVKTTTSARTKTACLQSCLSDVTCHLVNFLKASKSCEMSDYKLETLSTADFVDKDAGCQMYKRILV